MIHLRLAGMLLVAAALAACGGGGGSPGAVSGGGSTGGTPTSTSPTSPTAPVAAPTVTVGLVDSSGASVVSISVGGGYSVRAIVKDAAGAPVPNKTVNFSVANTAIATVTPATALTNASGIAEVSISPVTVSSVGASTVTAQTDVAGTPVTGSVDFAVQAANLTLSAVTAATASLPSGGNTQIQVTALVGGVPTSAIPVNVSFTASCGRINNQDASAGISVTTNGSGIASAVYDAVTSTGNLCSGAVTITASAAGAPTQSTVVTVAAPTANAVAFVSASPSQIFVAGSGAVDQAIVKFKVLSSAGTAMPNVPVTLSIVTNPGGVGLNAAGSTAPVSVTTGATGEASVSVFSGSIPGPVKVRAELSATPTVFSESQNLTVASGPPSQKFMSLAVSTFNIEGWGVDGSAAQLTARLADRQGNAVVDGTVVNFTAEGGQVARSCTTTTVNGISSCSVTFVSQNPRPSGGRASILAYAEGTKDYVDVNGNNSFDAGDTLSNMGDAYRDDNENGVFEGAAGEFVIPRGGTQTCAGTGAPVPGVVNTCDSLLKTTVRQQTTILFSSSTPILVPVSLTASSLNFRLASADNPLLPLPAGTTFTAEASGGMCAVDKLYGTPIVNVSPGTNPSADLTTSHMVTLKTCASGNQIMINVKVPSGLVTSIPVTIP